MVPMQHLVQIGRDGQPARDAAGKQVCVPSELIYGDPPSLGGPATTAGEKRSKLISRQQTGPGVETITVELKPSQP